MKTTYKKQKRNYTKPKVEQIKLDNEISIFMASPPGNPEFAPEGPAGPSMNVNPFKLPKL